MGLSDIGQTMEKNKNRAATSKFHYCTDEIWRECVSTGDRACYVGGEHKTLPQLAAAGGGTFSYGGGHRRQVSKLSEGTFYTGPVKGDGLKWYYTEDGERLPWDELRNRKRKQEEAAS